MVRLVQVGVIGAMQRVHPALTQLWLRWTGIHALDRAVFDTIRPDEPGPSGTQITLKPQPGVQAGWSSLCDAMGFALDAPERRTMPIRLSAKHPAHTAFWLSMRAREMTVVDGPLEWWWRLLILRQRGIRRASKVLLSSVFGEDQLINRATLSFDNPNLQTEGRQASDISTSYRCPERIVLSIAVSDTNKKEGLAFSLQDDKLRAQFTSSLIDLATSRLA